MTGFLHTTANEKKKLYLYDFFNFLHSLRFSRPLLNTCSFQFFDDDINFFSVTLQTSSSLLLPNTHLFTFILTTHIIVIAFDILTLGSCCKTRLTCLDTILRHKNIVNECLDLLNKFSLPPHSLFTPLRLSGLRSLMKITNDRVTRKKNS